MDYRKLQDPPFQYDFEPQSIIFPSHLVLDVPVEVQHELTEELTKLEKDFRLGEDYSLGLMGHLDKEFKLPIKEKTKYLTESLCDAFVRHFQMPAPGPNSKFELESLWVNYAKSGDFNPAHVHSGLFSFVIWVKVPYKLSEEAQKYTALHNLAGKFFFHYLSPLGETIYSYQDVDKDWEWKMILFPAKLHHGVYPFYTSDDYRVSISGNLNYISAPL